MNADVRWSGIWVREVQYLLLVASEAAWLYPSSLAANRWILRAGGPILDLPLLAAILLLAVVVTRLATTLAMWLRRDVGGTKSVWLPGPLGQLQGRRAAAPWVGESAVAVGVILAGLMGLAQLPPSSAGYSLAAVWDQLTNQGAGAVVVPVAGLAGILWWRGLRLGRVPPDPNIVVEEFLLGTVTTGILLVIAPLAAQVFPMPTEPFIISALVFLCTGLVGIPLARLMEVSGRPRQREERGLTPGGCWLTTLVAVVVILFLASLALTQLITFDRADVLWDIVRPAVTAALAAAERLITLVLEPVIQLVGFLVSLLLSFSRRSPSAGSPNPPSQQGDQTPPPPEIVLASKVVLILVLALVLIWVMRKVVSRLGSRWQYENIAERRDLVWTWPSAGTVWRRLLRLVRLLGAEAATMMPVGHGSRKPAGNAREVYAEFLALAAGLGLGRRPPETPLEYEHRLLDATGVGAQEVRSITEAYIQDRYAPPASRPMALGPVAAALARLRMLWQGVEGR